MFLLDILLHLADMSLSLFWSLTLSLSLIMFYRTVEANWITDNRWQNLENINYLILIMVQKMLARLKTLFKALWHILQRLKESQLLHDLLWPPSGLPRGSTSLAKDPKTIFRLEHYDHNHQKQITHSQQLQLSVQFSRKEGRQSGWLSRKEHCRWRTWRSGGGGCASLF